MPDQPFPRTGTGLSTVDYQTGKAPKSRVDDFQAALTIVEDLRRASEPRNLKAARILGQFQGNPPYNPQRQIAAGMKGFANFNTLEAKAYLSSALVPYYDLFASAPNQIEVTLDQRDLNLRDDWSRITTDELHRSVSSSTWFELNIWKMLHDYVGFGKGFLVWPDNVTHRFKRVSWDRVLFPDQTDVDPQEWEYFACIWHYNAHDLYRRVRNAERAKSMGWNTEATLYAIQTAAKYEPSNLNDWVGIQRQLHEHDLMADSQCDKIVTAWLFVKEFDGRWSWMVIPILSLLDPHYKKVPKEMHGFLYKRVGIYESINQIIAPFFFEVFDGNVNGLSGLGKDIFAPMQAKDKMACSKINNVFLRSSVLMQAKNATGRQKAALVQIGNVTVIPEGYDVQQSTILGDIESTIAVSRDFDLMLQANTGIYRPQFEKPQGNPETATAASLRFQQGTVLGNSAVNRFHRQLDGAYAELYRRIVKSGEKEAVQFRTWVEQRGVPIEALSKIIAVRSYRNMGNGSAFLRQTNIAALLQIFPDLPEDGKQNFLEMFVAAYGGQYLVDELVATPMRQQVPTQQMWDATVENASLKEGAPAQWTPQQDDVTHLTVHAQALGQALQSTQQGADPQAVAVFGHGVMQHVQAHFQSLQSKGKSRAKQVEAFNSVYKRLGQGVQTLTDQIQQQQQMQAQQAQQTQQVMSDEQLAEFEAQHKAQLSTMKTQHQMQLREAQAQQKSSISGAQARQKMVIADAQSATKIRNANLTAASKTATNGD